MRICFLVLFILLTGLTFAFRAPSYKIAKMKYNGGGDWYANRTALPELISFCNKNHFDREFHPGPNAGQRAALF